MKRKVLILLLVGIVSLSLFSGCLRYPKVEAPLEPREPVTVGASTTEGEAPYGIRLGKVFVGEFYPGAFVDTFTRDDKVEGIYKKGDPTGIIIVNNLNEARHYQLTCIQPNQLQDGYSKAPDYVLEEWVRISNPNPVLGAKEIKLIPISLWMPPDAEVFADKWEFRIRVKDIDQTGFAQTAYEARWLVEMMEE